MAGIWIMKMRGWNIDDIGILPVFFSQYTFISVLGLNPGVKILGFDQFCNCLPSKTFEQAVVIRR
jgi:hypothetical protein